MRVLIHLMYNPLVPPRFLPHPDGLSSTSSRLIMQADTRTATAGNPTIPSEWRVWLLAIRVPTLSAAIVPVLVGSALAARAHHFNAPIFTVVLCAAILIQIGTNLTNDF